MRQGWIRAVPGDPAGGRGQPAAQGVLSRRPMGLSTPRPMLPICRIPGNFCFHVSFPVLNSFCCYYCSISHGCFSGTWESWHMSFSLRHIPWSPLKDRPRVPCSSPGNMSFLC